MQLDKIEDAVAAIAAGDPVIVVDDDDRENEGDLIVAAAAISSETMGFLVRHTSGIICVPMTAERAARLNLPPMVARNTDPKRTGFTVSVDYKPGLTTGISAAERASTARGLANERSKPDDFARPGHVFPLIAREGGVLTRSGHTEAATDLTRLADLSPVGVLAEIVNENGTLKRLPDLMAFAAMHDLKIVSIEDLIAERLRCESFVSCVGEEAVTVADMPGRLRIYETRLDPMQHMALVFGNVADGNPVPVHLHHDQPLADFHQRAGGVATWMDGALRDIRPQGRGVVIEVRAPILREDMAGTASAIEDGEHHRRANERRRRWQETGIGTQILRDLGVGAIALADSQTGLDGFGLDVVAPVCRAG